MTDPTRVTPTRLSKRHGPNAPSQRPAHVSATGLAVRLSCSRQYLQQPGGGRDRADSGAGVCLRQHRLHSAFMLLDRLAKMGR
jgi:hypothetical protein